MELFFPTGLLSLILCIHGISGEGNDANMGSTRGTTPSSGGSYQITSEKPLVFTSIIFEPYLMENPDKNAKGNDRYIGFIADLVKELARRLDFKYKLKLVDDGKWGSRDTSTGQWNGMIGEVISSKADMAAAPITITSVRKTVVTFSNAYQDVTTTAVVKAGSSFTNLDQLLASKNMTFGCIAGGATANAFKGNMQFTRLWAEMESKNSFVSSTAKGKARVLKGNYAFFTEKPYAEYMVSQDCRLEMVGSILPSQGYAFPVSKHNRGSQQLLRSINQGLAEIKKDGTIQKLEDTWWVQQPCSGVSVATSMVLIMSALLLTLTL